MKRSAWMAIVLLLSVTRAAADDDGGTQSPLLIGSGAREQAMGRTGAAISQHAEALFWNPARLVTNQHTELSLFRSELFLDSSVYHAAFLSYPTLDFGTLGIGYQRLDISTIERIDERNRSLGTFDNGESNLLLGYGRRMASLVSAGAALRIVQQSLDTASDVGVGLDLGIAFERNVGRHHWLSFGTNLQNIVEPKLRLSQDEVRDPRSIKTGLGVGGLWVSRRLRWTAAMDVDLPSTANARIGMGAEFSWSQTLSLRAGVDHDQATFGVGVAYHNVRFDYAMRSAGELPRNDRFTLALRFGASLNARRQEVLQEQQRQVSAELERLLEEREHNAKRHAREQADVALADQRHEEALRLYRRVLALDPDDHDARERMDAVERRLLLDEATGLANAGHPVQAAAKYQSILERWPENADASAGLRAAREQLQRSADRERTLRELLGEALARFSSNDLVAAEATLTELLRIDPTENLASDLLARVQGARAQQGAARLDEARALAAGGNYGAALRLLADARQLLGARNDLETLAATWEAARRQAAERDARRLAMAPEDQAPPPPRMLAAAEERELDRLYQEGLRAFSNREFDRAIRSWKAVWVAMPAFADVADNLIKAYLYEGVELYARGNYEAALERCRRVLEIDPSNEKALRYLRRIQEEKDEVEEIGRGRREG